jgi:hypothetical protein
MPGVDRILLACSLNVRKQAGGRRLLGSEATLAASWRSAAVEEITVLRRPDGIIHSHGRCPTCF